MCSGWSFWDGGFAAGYAPQWLLILVGRAGRKTLQVISTLSGVLSSGTHSSDRKGHVRITWCSSHQSPMVVEHLCDVTRVNLFYFK